MLKRVSLKKTHEFKRVYNQGMYAANDSFVVYALANSLGYHRLGITTSKKVGCAVVRNRVRRWVKESFYNFPPVYNEETAFDFVVVARAPAGKLQGKGALSTVNVTLAQLYRRINRRKG